MPATDFIYYNSDGNLTTSVSTSSACVFGDHKFVLGGGVTLPFEYRSAQLLDSAPVEAYPGIGGWSIALKGAGGSTAYQSWEICSAVRSKIRTAKFSVPADGKAHSKVVSCAKDERVLSGGVSNSPGEDFNPADRSIVASYPVDGPDKGHARGDAWKVTSRASKSFKKKAIASIVCVKTSRMAVRYAHLDFVATQRSFGGVYVTCDQSQQVVGGGVQLQEPKKGIAITTSAPRDSPDDVDTDEDDRWATGIDGPNKGRTDARNWAVCVEVRG